MPTYHDRIQVHWTWSDLHVNREVQGQCLGYNSFANLLRELERKGGAETATTHTHKHILCCILREAIFHDDGRAQLDMAAVSSVALGWQCWYASARAGGRLGLQRGISGRKKGWLLFSHASHKFRQAFSLLRHYFLSLVCLLLGHTLLCSGLNLVLCSEITLEGDLRPYSIPSWNPVDVCKWSATPLLTLLFLGIIMWCVKKNH